MHDVARLAGVSVQTVSNFVNGRFAKLSPTTRETVQSAIELLDYRINNTARGLRSSRTRTLAFLAVDDSERFIADPLNGNYLAGFVDTARKHGYSVLIHSAPDSERLLTPVDEGRVDAVCVLLSGPPSRRRRIAERLDRSPVEYVVLDETTVVQGLDRAFTVRANQDAGAEALVDHLVGRGHDRIAFIASATPWAVIEQRFAGYRAALRRHQISTDPDLELFEAGWEPAGAVPMIDRLLGLADPPTAVMCGSDLVALGAIRHLHDRGFAVPGEFAVCGYDDFDFSAQTIPAITTVQVPAYQAGIAAAELLIASLDGEPAAVRNICLDVALMVRESA